MFINLKKVDSESIDAINNFFSGMQWPIPEDSHYLDIRDYFHASGGRALTFITDLGLVVRLTPQNAVSNLKHPHILNSLFNRLAGQYQIDLDPGYDCPVSRDHCLNIYQALTNVFGLVSKDRKPHNLAYVPGTNYPVMIDLDPEFLYQSDAFILDSNDLVDTPSWAHIQTMPLDLKRDETTPDLQIEMYRPLRDLINQAWPANQDYPDPEGIQEFKQLCQTFKAQGKLLSCWDDPDKDYCGTTLISRNYAKKISMHR